MENASYLSPRRHLFHVAIFVISALFLPQAALSQLVKNAVTADPGPILALISQRYPALALVHSVRMNATAQWTVGNSTESGAAVMTVQSDGSSTVQLDLQSGSRSENRKPFSPTRVCEWKDLQGEHPLNVIDCSQYVTWFAPFASLLPQPAALLNIVIDDLGEATDGALPIRRLNFKTTSPVTTAGLAKYFTDGSQVTMALDTTTLMPSSIQYKAHADSDIGLAVDVRVRYSDFRASNGLLLPYKIERYVNNSLQLALAVSDIQIQ